MPFDRLPSESLVVITGATGFIGSSCAELLLKKGYRVRGVTRNLSVASPLIAHFDSLYGAGKFELVEHADLGASGVAAQLLQGASGFIHVANAVLLAVESTDAVATISETNVALLKAAAEIPSIKSVVFTSSRVAVYTPAYGKDIAPSLDHFEEQYLGLAKQMESAGAKADPAMAAQLQYATYCACKVASEKGAWDYWREAKPSYSFNTVLGDICAGPLSNPFSTITNTHTLLNDIFRGSKDSLLIHFMNPPSLIADIRDCAAIHVGALLSSSVSGERLWVARHAYTLNQILAIWRKKYPERAILPDFDFPEPPKVTVDDSKSTELLQELEGRGWYSLEDAVLANVEKAS